MPGTRTPLPRPRRVLMTADAVGGVWPQSLELARGLAAAEIEVILAVMGPPPTAGQRGEALAVPGLRLEERYRRHVNRRTGRRAGEFFEDVLVARVPG